MINKNYDDAVSLEQDNVDQDIIENARKLFPLAKEAASENYKKFEEDVSFSYGNQWDPNIKRNREADGRPCLTVNKLNQSINQVTNDQRQNRPSIKIRPIDDTGDVEIAKVAQGIIRNIEQVSNADTAYDTAFEYTARGGFGFIRLITKYENEKSFNLDLEIKRVKDPLSILIDPNSVEPDGSDADYAFAYEEISKDEYCRLYGESKLAKSRGSDWFSFSSSSGGFISENSCIVTEFFFKEHSKKKIYLLSNGKTVEQDELEIALNEPLDEFGSLPEIVKERESDFVKIAWVKTNGIEILEKTYFPGKYIPIVKVSGAELVVEGKTMLKGITRDAIDPAKMYNYWKSAETEAIALAPKAPFIVAEGQIEGYKKEWASANNRNHAFLTYKPTSINGQLIGPPQRNSFEPAVGAITQASMLASDDIKAVTGIYDAALGARSNETSGIAISNRRAQAQTSNFHLIDNLTRSIKQVGRILMCAIPEVYDSARAARIIGDDGEEKIVKINQPFIENGKQVLYTFDAGKYDVAVDVGPTFQSKRQEAVSSMLELSRANPSLMGVAGDLFVKNMDWPGAQEIADRIKKTLPPNLVDEGKNKQNEIPPQVQAQMQQMNQMIEQLTERLKEANNVMDNKLIEIESRERIEMAKLENQAAIELAKLESKDSLMLLQQQIKELDNRQKMLGMYEPIEREPLENEYDQEDFTAPQMNDGDQFAGQQFEAQPQQPIGGPSPSTTPEGMI